MFIHEDEQRHGPGIISGDFPQTFHDSGITSVEEEGPHVDDVLMGRQPTQTLVLVLVVLANLQARSDCNISHCNEYKKRERGE